MKTLFSYLRITFLLILCHCSIAQDNDLLNQLEAADSIQTQMTTATFKGTYLINGQSVELVGPGVLQFMIEHRFGTFEQGGYDLFGLDNANTRFGFDYGVNKWLNIGVARSSVQKVYDGFLKIKLFNQKKGAKNFPLTVDYYGDLSYNTLRWGDERDNDINRFAYVNQLLIARKFSERFSVQLSPTFVHKNYVNDPSASNNVFALGAAARLKISKRVALMGEYFWVPEGQNSKTYVNVASIGVDIETGGHVFQLHFTNSNSMNEYIYLTDNDQQWAKNQFRFGFNVSRVFTVNRKAAERY